ncbi:MAG: SLC13 family permease [Schleiferiaceae bacterium]|nr:SLC13 family permease [Schleiferiaceae bacterium]MDR9442346.1 SLC13 family permease [Schleiferiaceae bacterium]
MGDSFSTIAVFGVLLIMIVVLVLDRFKSSLVFLVAALLLVGARIIPMEDFTSGFANTSILTIFLLIIITGGVNAHFNVAGLFKQLFGGARSLQGFILRLGMGVTSLSALMNNTPVVAVMMPHVYDWGKRNGYSPAKVLMPLSFAAIFGGVITLIGTSTNLVLNGLLTANGHEALAFFDFTAPGLMVAGGSLLTITLLAPRLLKDKGDVLSQAQAKKREYLVETRIKPGAKLVGLTVEKARLRNLEEAYLTEIIRAGYHVAPVGPEERLEEADILLFAGNTDSIIELVKRSEGLELSKTLEFDLVDNTEVVEAVVAQNATLDRRNVKEIGFREKYDAAIIGIHRRGERVSGKIGQQELRSGDLLMMVAGSEFRERNARSQDLVVISAQPREDGLSQPKRWLFWLLTTGLIGLAALGWASLFEALLGVALVQVSLGMLTLEKIKQSISLDLLFILVSALALGRALIDSGAADWLSQQIFHNAGQWNSLALLAGIFGITFLLTSLVTNVAAVSIVFPILFGLAGAVGIPAKVLFLTAAFGASCCFVTPYAYQTNLMVMELGKYNFADFIRLGIPVSIVYAGIYLTYAYFVYLI